MHRARSEEIPSALPIVLGLGQTGDRFSKVSGGLIGAKSRAAARIGKPGRTGGDQDCHPSCPGKALAGMRLSPTRAPFRPPDQQPTPAQSQRLVAVIDVVRSWRWQWW